MTCLRALFAKGSFAFGWNEGTLGGLVRQSGDNLGLLQERMHKGRIRFQDHGGKITKYIDPGGTMADLGCDSVQDLVRKLYGILLGGNGFRVLRGAIPL